MSERITVHNKTSLSLAEALRYVAVVIDGGNISTTAGRKHPCHATLFFGGVLVLCRPTRAGNLSFTVEQEVGRE